MGDWVSSSSSMSNDPPSTSGKLPVPCASAARDISSAFRFFFRFVLIVDFFRWAGGSVYDELRAGLAASGWAYGLTNVGLAGRVSVYHLVRIRLGRVNQYRSADGSGRGAGCSL